MLCNVVFPLYSKANQPYIYIYIFGSGVKNPPVNVGDVGSVPGSGRFLGGGNGNPLQYSCLEKSPGQRSLAGYTPWGGKSWTRLSD